MAMPVLSITATKAKCRYTLRPMPSDTSEARKNANPMPAGYSRGLATYFCPGTFPREGNFSSTGLKVQPQQMILCIGLPSVDPHAHAARSG